MQPLAHRRILVTRAAGQASALATLLAAEGADVLQIPTIAIAPPASYCALDAALTTLRSFDWLLFTSANAVQAFATRARTLGLSSTPRRVAAIGPATARAVIDAGVATHVDLMPPSYVAEALAEALTPHAAGASMLLVRAAEARDTLVEALTTAGAQMTVVPAYRTVIPEDSIDNLRKLFLTSPPDAITLTSASTARNLVALLGQAGLALPRQVTLASIGPITSTAMRELSLEPSLEAAESTIPALVASLANYFKAT